MKIHPNNIHPKPISGVKYKYKSAFYNEVVEIYYIKSESIFHSHHSFSFTKNSDEIAINIAEYNWIPYFKEGRIKL